MSTGAHPAFGTADLTNCERELIHLAGSIQPYGALLVMDPSDLRITQASANAPAYFGRAMDQLLGSPVETVSAELHSAARLALDAEMPTLPGPFRCTLRRGPGLTEIEGVVHLV